MVHEPLSFNTDISLITTFSPLKTEYEYRNTLVFHDLINLQIINFLHVLELVSCMFSVCTQKR